MRLQAQVAQHRQQQRQQDDGRHGIEHKQGRAPQAVDKHRRGKQPLVLPKPNKFRRRCRSGWSGIAAQPDRANQGHEDKGDEQDQRWRQE